MGIDRCADFRRNIILEGKCPIGSTDQRSIGDTHLIDQTRFAIGTENWNKVNHGNKGEGENKRKTLYPRGEKSRKLSNYLSPLGAGFPTFSIRFSNRWLGGAL